MFRVILIHMPFADINRPSIGLSLLKAGLDRAGIQCDIVYFNLHFAQFIGRTNYTRIDAFSSEPQLGEWIFADAVFGSSLPDPVRYYANILRPALIEPFASNPTAFAELMEESQLLAGLISLRKKAAEFLTSCLNSYDWGQYNIVGFTTTFQQNVAALGLARLIKEKYPQTLIAFGGANCEGKMGLALHRLFPFVDIVCSGEGDRSFIQFTTALASGEQPPVIDGIIHRLNGEVAQPTALSNPISEMDQLPIPDYSDFFAERAKLDADNDSVTLPVESARGCWWGEKAHCTFCGLNGSTMHFRKKSPARFLGEINELVGRYQVREFSAVDNIIDMGYFQSVLPELAKSDLDVHLFYETKANLHRSQVRLLREAGVTHIQPGIESLSTHVLRLMRKGIQAYQNIRLLRWCAEYLIRPSWNMLGGFPDEDPCEFAEQAALIPLIMHLPPPIAVAAVRLDRFSPLYEQGKEFGLQRIRPSDAYHYIYPLADVDLNELVYFFDFDYADGRQPNDYLQELRQAVDDWKNAKQTDGLIYLDDGKVLTFIDNRPVRTAQHHILEGWERLVYEQCEEGATLEGLKRGLQTAGFLSKTDAELHVLIQRLLEAHLIIEIDNRYLGVAVSGNYRLEMLGRHLVKGAKLPVDLKLAAQRLFDLHPDGFGHHLAPYLA